MMTTSSHDVSALAAAFANASAEDQTILAEQLAHNAAITDIFNQPPLLVETSSIYQIDEARHLQAALTDGRFDVIENTEQLTRFLADTLSEAAIIKASTGLNLASLEQTLAACPSSKILLWDATA